MSGLRGFAATDRAVLRVAGPEARGWLQDLVTNDVSAAAPDRAVYAALLTPQGKYLFDFFVLDGGGEALLIDVAAERAPALAQRLGLYKIRRKVTVEDVSETETVALVWGEGAPTPPPPAIALADPRAAALGWRIYGPDPAAALAAVGAAEGTRSEYDALRVAACAPETGVELIPDETFILEAGFDRLNGVDFRKGCYVGQEVTARMRHKTELRKGLLRVKVEGRAPPPGAAAVSAEGKPAGALFTVAGDEGLAHLRFDRAEGATAGGARLTPIA